jgi:predicted Zn-dependent peptidase
MEAAEYPRLGEKAFRATLSNGLRLIVVPKEGFAHSYALLASDFGSNDMRFRVGGGEWTDTPAGIAHYLEHKMFDTKDGSALKELSVLGAEPNAFTGNSMTAYYFDSTKNFEKCLRILLSFVSVPYFTGESVEKERGIIAQEIRMIEDDPDWQVYSNLLRGLYRSHPARIPVAGTVDSIAGITPELLYSCHGAFYAPSNMALCVVGDVKPDEILKAAEEVLPDTEGKTIERDYGADDGERAAFPSIETAMEVSAPMFLCGYKCPAPAGGEEAVRAELVGNMACDILFGESSPLYASLYSDGTINATFGGAYESMPGAAFIYAGGESRSPRKVHLAIAEEAERLALEGIDEDFYLQIRRATFGQLLRQLNSFENIAVSMAQGAFRGADYYRFPEIFDTIGKGDIVDFLRCNIVPDRACISIVKSKGE